MTDYHTVQSAKNMNKRFFYTRREEVKTKVDKFESLETTLSSRVYLTDAAFTVCVWSAPEDGQAGDAGKAGEAGEKAITLEDVHQALLKPRLTLYLGRKSCPLSRPLVPKIEEAAHIAEAFQRYIKTYGEIMQEPLSASAKDIRLLWPLWTDVDCGMDMDTHIVCQVKDRVLCSARRQYGMRDEYCSTLSPIDHATAIASDASTDASTDAIECALDGVFHTGDKHYVYE